jgi:hypothetical protein
MPRWGRSRTIFWRRYFEAGGGIEKKLPSGAKALRIRTTNGAGLKPLPSKAESSSAAGGLICAVALLDVSTGEFRTAEFQGRHGAAAGGGRDSEGGSSEVLLAASAELPALLERIPARTRVEDWVWTREFAVPLVERQLNVRRWKALG